MDYKMITVNEYLNVLDGEDNLNAKDIETMMTVEKYLSEVENEKNYEEIVNELLG